MIITTNQNEISQAIESLKRENPNAIVGFVPTMGALHNGHMSLIKEAVTNCDIVVSSIFVNPTQFNNSKDLDTYPRTVEADKQLLQEHGCDIVFIPTSAAVYPNGIQPYSINLDGLDEGMEGAFRPGHFKGVCMVVQRFFEIVRPNKAYFGKKDFQQLAILRRMTAIREFPIEIIGVPILRAENGLALSSRNALLSDQEREDAALIYRALLAGLKHYNSTKEVHAIQAKIESYFADSYMEIEYIAFVDNKSLVPVTTLDANCTVCIVVFCGEVRLIDNLQFSAAEEHNETHQN